MTETQGLASRELFLSAAIRRYMEIDVADFGRVRMQSLTEKEQSDFEAWPLGAGGKMQRGRLSAVKRKLMVLCLVDEQGARLFDDVDTDTLGNLDGKVADAIFQACTEHCGIAADATEDAAKN